MNFPTYDNPNINLLSQVKTVKNRAIWGASIVHNKVKIKSTKQIKYKAESRMTNREERETKCHHDLIIIPMGVAQVVMHNLHLHV